MVDAFFPLINAKCKYYQFHSQREDSRAKLNNLYSMYQKCLDKKFVSQAQSDLPASYSELYFCHAVSSRLKFKPTHISDEGPDFYIPELNCWVEIVTATNGLIGSPEYLATPESGVVFEYPTNKIFLRVSGALTGKFKGALRNIEREIITNKHSVVICINGGWLNGDFGRPSHPVGGFPLIVQLLYGIGEMSITLSRKTREVIGSGFTVKPTLTKTNKNNIENEFDIAYFWNPQNTVISAVIYSYATILSTIDEDRVGEDFIVVHNAFANNPIPPGAFGCGKEYIARSTSSEEITLTLIDHEATNSVSIINAKSK